MTQIATKTLNWQHSTTTVFEALCNDDWAVLLDSADAEHPDAQVDIIAANPIATLVTQGDITTITDAQNQQQHQGEPFELLQQAITRYFPDKKTCQLPFSGGAIGAFSYDLGRKIETLPVIANADIALPEMNIGLYEWALIYQRKQQQWQLVHYQGKAHLNHVLTWLEQQLMQQSQHAQAKNTFKLTQPWQAQISQTQYQEKFEQIQAHLKQGNCYQINLTQRFSASYLGDEWSAYLKLRQANAAPFSGFMRLNKTSCIMSLSPERFIHLKTNGDISTKPIKGTLPRCQQAAKDKQQIEKLRQSSKDRAENVMIVDLLRNDIGKVAVAGSVEVPVLFDVESFPAVHHLVSTVTATLPPHLHATDLLKATFPGGSITGAPKVKAMEIIETLEPSRRSIYCGSLGYISQDGQMDTSIAIRTLIATNGMLHCWAGGGIVADSNANDEYQESYDKVSKILPVLSNSQQT